MGPGWAGAGILRNSCNRLRLSAQPRTKLQPLKTISVDPFWHVGSGPFSRGKTQLSDRSAWVRLGPPVEIVSFCTCSVPQGLSLLRQINLKKHNDLADPYHMDEHQTFCLDDYQFKDGAVFMCVSTVHILINWCAKDFGPVGISCNSMDFHFNLGPVSLSIVTSESKDAIEYSRDAPVWLLQSDPDSRTRS